MLARASILVFNTSSLLAAWQFTRSSSPLQPDARRRSRSRNPGSSTMRASFRIRWPFLAAITLVVQSF
jgi:hypothetical protein